MQAIVDQGQDQEEVQIEIKIGVIHEGNMIILQRLSYIQRRKRNRTNPKTVQFRGLDLPRGVSYRHI